MRSKKPVAVRISADLKEAATLRAREENRSFASYLEWLIIQDVKAHALSDEAETASARL